MADGFWVDGVPLHEPQEGIRVAWVDAGGIDRIEHYANDPDDIPAPYWISKRAVGDTTGACDLHVRCPRCGWRYSSTDHDEAVRLGNEHAAAEH